MGAVVLLMAAAAGAARIWLRADVIDSIVVLPATGASAGQRAVDITEGVAASLTNSLSQLAGLRVAPRYITATPGDDPGHPEAIARRLGMHGVLLVRVVPRGESAVLNLVLVDALHSAQIWGEQYTVRLEEIELAQESISTEVAETLRLRFNAEERRAQEVFQLYQRGRYYAAKRTEK